MRSASLPNTVARQSATEGTLGAWMASFGFIAAALALIYVSSAF